MSAYVHPDDARLRRILSAWGDRPLTMLNLLRFRDEADYSASPELAPDEAISGAQAYATYEGEAGPHLFRHSGGLRLEAAGSEMLIGPDGERWDKVLLVDYPSPAAFLALVSDPAYLAIVGHRTAAIADSRLMPMTR